MATASASGGGMMGDAPKKQSVERQFDKQEGEWCTRALAFCSPPAGAMRTLDTGQTGTAQL